MCGIAGICYKKNVDLDQKKRFSELVRSMQHTRGPDAFNELQINEKSFFFHNRLSIIDIEHAKQPMEDEHAVLVFNGEIYNYQSLKYENIPYCYQSDTEVLLKGFFREKEKFLQRTNSMFGFGFYDKNEQILTLCRDRVGIKQIYYIDNDEIFAFASTLKPLVLFSQKILNTSALWKYYLNRAFKAPNTIFNDIRELVPGSMLQFDIQNGEIIKTEKWWEKKEMTEEYTDEKEVLSTLDNLLHTSVQDRLVSDVPVGAFLSGGVDSSIVTAIASQYAPNIEAFTVSMEDTRYDEAPYAKAVTDRYGIKYHQVRLNGKEFLDDMESWIAMQDDIVANPSSLLLHKLALLASDNGYKVMLAGEGADELFAGYACYKRFLVAKELYKYCQFLKPFAVPISTLFRSDSRKEYFVRNLLSDPSHYGAANIFEPHIIETMLKTEIEKKKTNSLKEALSLDIEDRIPNDLLTSNADRAAMGASIESRVPFLSHQIIDYSSAIDSRLFTKGGELKYLLKKLAEKYIPKENIYRKKMGFEMPLHDWFRDEFKDLFYELLETSVQKDVIDIDMIRSFFEAHLKKKIDASAKLFAFMSLELSYRHLSKIH